MSRRLEWSDSDVLAARRSRCTACDQCSNRRNTPAVTLAVVLGFRADGGGGATLQPLCAHHARQPNAVPCTDDARDAVSPDAMAEAP